mmetsp:Transcript_9016/g.28998  ORF Transcript_9016/g.28998 Transcript_9016/m.28998 type:complete len:255 (+) Transcript_9016:990-1754(+)
MKSCGWAGQRWLRSGLPARIRGWPSQQERRSAQRLSLVGRELSLAPADAALSPGSSGVSARSASALSVTSSAACLRSPPTSAWASSPYRCGVVGCSCGAEGGGGGRGERKGSRRSARQAAQVYRLAAPPKGGTPRQRACIVLRHEEQERGCELAPLNSSRHTHAVGWREEEDGKSPGGGCCCCRCCCCSRLAEATNPGPRPTPPASAIKKSWSVICPWPADAASCRASAAASCPFRSWLVRSCARSCALVPACS